MTNKLLLAISLAISLSGCAPAMAEPNYSQLADAIKKVEGVPYYGIKSVSWKDYADARRICIRTAQHAWRDYRRAMGVKTTKKGYLAFLGSRYCPAISDPIGHGHWIINMNKLYQGGV